MLYASKAATRCSCETGVTRFGGRDEACRVAGEDRLVDEILGEQRFAQPVGRDDDDVFPLGQEVEREDALDGRAMDLRRPRPFEIGQGFEAAEPSVVEPALDALIQAGRQLRLRELFEEHDGAPALLGGARDQIVEFGGRVAEPQLAQVAARTSTSSTSPVPPERL